MTEYAAFGLGNPNEYRTVFMTEKTKPPEGRTIAEMEEGNPAMKALIGRVEACVAAGKLRAIHAPSPPCCGRSATARFRC